METETPKIEALHQLYCDLVGYRLGLSLERHYWWSHWIGRSFVADDLRLVIQHIQKGIKNGSRHAGALKWSNLIRDVDHFEEELQEARAFQRNVPPKPMIKDKWLPKSPDTARHVSEIMPDISELVKAAHEACERKEA